MTTNTVPVTWTKRNKDLIIVVYIILGVSILSLVPIDSNIALMLSRHAPDITFPLMIASISVFIGSLIAMVIYVRDASEELRPKRLGLSIVVSATVSALLALSIAPSFYAQLEECLNLSAIMSPLLLTALKYSLLASMFTLVYLPALMAFSFILSLFLRGETEGFRYFHYTIKDFFRMTEATAKRFLTQKRTLLLVGPLLVTTILLTITPLFRVYVVRILLYVLIYLIIYILIFTTMLTLIRKMLSFATSLKHMFVITFPLAIFFSFLLWSVSLDIASFLIDISFKLVNTNINSIINVEIAAVVLNYLSAFHYAQLLLLFSVMAFVALVNLNDYYKMFGSRLSIAGAVQTLVSLLALGGSIAILTTITLEINDISFMNAVSFSISITTFTIFWFLYVLMTLYTSKLDEELYVYKDATLWPAALTLPFSCPLDDNCIHRAVVMPIAFALIVIITSLIDLMYFTTTLSDSKSIISQTATIMNIFTSLFLPLAIPLINHYVQKLLNTREEPCTYLKEMIKIIVRKLHLRVSNMIVIAGFGWLARILVHKLVNTLMYDKDLHVENIPMFKPFHETGVSMHNSVWVPKIENECVLGDQPVVASITVVDVDDNKHYWCGAESMRDNISFCLTRVKSYDTFVLTPSPHLRLGLEESLEEERNASFRYDVRESAFYLPSVRGDAAHDFLFSTMRAPNGITIDMIPDVDASEKIMRNMNQERFYVGTLGDVEAFVTAFVTSSAAGIRLHRGLLRLVSRSETKPNYLFAYTEGPLSLTELPGAPASPLLVQVVEALEHLMAHDLINLMYHEEVI